MKQLLSLILLVILIDPACAKKESKYISAFDRGDIKDEMVAFRTIKDEADSIIGYIKEVVWRETQRSGWQAGAELFRLSYIYDKSYRQMGFISSQGEARSYRTDVKGEVYNHGILTLDEGIRRILILDRSTKINIEDVEPLNQWEIDLKK